MTQVLFFGRVADLIGRSRDIDLPDAGCTIGELRARLGAEPGADILLRPGVRASIDREIVGDDARVPPGAEVAFFSVFSGG